MKMSKTFGKIEDITMEFSYGAAYIYTEPAAVPAAPALVLGSHA